MRRIVTWTAALVLTLPCLVGAAGTEEGEPASAPEMSPEMAAMMEAMERAGAPGEAHAQLAEAVGEWDITVKMFGDPEAEPTVSEGTATRSTILGGRVLKEKVDSEVMGQPFSGLGFTGFDNTTGQYWSIWMDSLSTAAYVSEGRLDESTGEMVFEAKMIDPMTGNKKHTRMVGTFEDDGAKETWKSYVLDGEGNETLEMKMVYKRRS